MTYRELSIVGPSMAAGVLLLFLFQQFVLIYRKRALRKLKQAILNHKGFTLKKGWAHNPLLSYPRNYPCFCGTGEKFKKCCLAGLPQYVKEDKVKELKQGLEDCLAFVEQRPPAKF